MVHKNKNVLFVALGLVFGCLCHADNQGIGLLRVGGYDIGSKNAEINAIIQVNKKIWPSKMGRLRPACAWLKLRSWLNNSDKVLKERINVAGVVGAAFDGTLWPQSLGRFRPIGTQVWLQTVQNPNNVIKNHQIDKQLSISWHLAFAEKLLPAWLGRFRPDRTTVSEFVTLNVGAKELRGKDTVCISYTEKLWPAWLKRLRPQKTSCTFEIEGIYTKEKNKTTGDSFTKYSADFEYGKNQLPAKLGRLRPDITTLSVESDGTKIESGSLSFSYKLATAVATIKCKLKNGSHGLEPSLGFNFSNDTVLGQ